MQLRTNQASRGHNNKLSGAGGRLKYQQKQAGSEQDPSGVPSSVMEVGFNWFQAHKEALLSELAVLRAEVYELSQCFPPSEQKGLASAMRQTAQTALTCIVDGLEHKVDGDLARDLDAGYGHLLDLVQQVYMVTDLGLLTQPQKQALELKIAGLCLRVGAVYKALFKRLPRIYPRGGLGRTNGLGTKRTTKRKR